MLKSLKTVAATTVLMLSFANPIAITPAAAAVACSGGIFSTPEPDCYCYPLPDGQGGFYYYCE